MPRSLGSESDPNAPPPLDLQKEFWGEWNRTWRLGALDGFMERQRDTAISVAQAAGFNAARILDVGCGTGWLGNSLLSFGRVWGTDLSPDAIEAGTVRHPGVELICGDFLELELPGPFDYVVCADALAHMRDQAACISRIAGLLRPGGVFLLMTQNATVWRHRSLAKPLGKGQHQVWPSLAECRRLLDPYFVVERISSLDPGGDKGLLWWVENRYVRGGMGRLVGKARWRSLLESARLGRELVIVARRRTG
jgi:SAM-dependent methyltransferase